jgi:hypothetical protein
MNAAHELDLGQERVRAIPYRWIAVAAALAVALGTVGFVVLLSDGGSGPSVGAPIQYVRPGDAPITFASAATDGVLTVAVPRGTSEVRQGGELGYVLPARIDLKVGDTVVIVNNDISPHLVMWAFVMPGQTVERVFEKPGSETYSAGCTVDPTPAGFSTIFIAE